MAQPSSFPIAAERPSLAAVVELLKPITWFAPMWAYGCGVVGSGLDPAAHWPQVVGGIVLAGPLVCATSQAVNDWFDRHVDAINEPLRPIPSGRIPGNWGLAIAILWSALSVAFAACLGVWVLVAAVIGLALAWAYSAPPLRLKLNGWWGNAAVGACYEGLPWFTGAAALTGALPTGPNLLLAALYSLGAHGIMTLNDFKSIDGDRRMGVASLPASLGADRAAKLACAVMALPQALVIALLIVWGRPYHGAAVALSLAVQITLMPTFLAAPRDKAPWYNATGTSLYVIGMLIAAFAVRSL